MNDSPKEETLRRRPKWITRTIALVITLVLLAVALIVTEATLKRVVPENMASELRTALELSPDHPVDIAVSGMMLPQLIRGSFNEVNVAASEVPIAEGFRADLNATAKNFPVNPEKNELGSTKVTAKFTEEQLSEVLSDFSSGIGQELLIEGDHLAVKHSFPLFGQNIPITISFEAAVIDGALHITPTGVEAGGILTLTVDQLKDVQLLAPIADGIDLCVADRLPTGVTLDGIELSTTKTLSLTVSIDPRIGIDPKLQKLGTCAE